MDDDKIDVTEETEFVRRAMKRFQDCKQHSGDWREEAKEDYRFVAGDQWDEKDKATLKRELRPGVTFNRVGVVVDAVSGAEINNRQEVRYIPRELGDVKVNEILTSAAQYVRDNCDAEDEESDAFLDSVICGMGWTETRMDYDTDEGGDVVIDRLDPFEMYWDPTATKRNLDDARYIFRVKDDMPPDEFEEMFPGQKEKVAMGGDLVDGFARSDKVAGDEYRDTENHDWEKPRGYQVIEYQWVDKEDAYKVADPFTGQPQTFPKDKFEKLNSRLEMMGMPFKSAKIKKKAIKRAYICNGVLLEKGPAPCSDHFNYRCITAKRDRAKNTWYGLVRAMKDPQRWKNKFFSQALHILNTGAKGGIMAEEGAFVNQTKAEADWSRPDSITMVTSGALTNNKIQPKPHQGFPPQLGQLMEAAGTAVYEASGVNVEALGLADRQQAGIVENARRQSALTNLAGLFDGLRRYRKEQGRVLLYFIQKYISDGRLIRVTGEENDRYVQLAKQSETARYDVIVDDAPTSPNQKEAVWAILMNLMPSLTKLPLPPEVWGELIKYSPLPGSAAAKIAKAIQPPPGPNPKEELAMAHGQADLQEKQANTQLKQAQTQKTITDAEAAKVGMQLDTIEMGAALEGNPGAAHVG